MTPEEIYPFLRFIIFIIFIIFLVLICFFFLKKYYKTDTVVFNKTLDKLDINEIIDTHDKDEKHENHDKDEKQEKHEKDEKHENHEKIENKEEVFHVGNNLFNYDESKALCKSYGATLATYDQVVDAYKNGADWCSYGWSDNQMALFPTQKDTWDKLQKAPENHRNDCGSVGINGGFFEDKDLKLGANCFGVKKSKDQNKNVQHNDYISHEKVYEDDLVDYFKKTNADFSIVDHSRVKWSQNA